MRWPALPVLLALAACGQKGNLYLPDEGVETVPVSTVPTNTGPATAAPATPEAPATSPAGAATPADQDPDPDKPARRN